MWLKTGFSSSVCISPQINASCQDNLCIIFHLNFIKLFKKQNNLLQRFIKMPHLKNEL